MKQGGRQAQILRFAQIYGVSNTVLPNIKPNEKYRAKKPEQPTRIAIAITWITHYRKPSYASLQKTKPNPTNSICPHCHAMHFLLSWLYRRRPLWCHAVFLIQSESAIPIAPLPVILNN